MKNRGLKNRIAISTSIDKDLYEKLQIISKETDIPISRLFDKSIKILLNNAIITSPK